MKNQENTEKQILVLGGTGKTGSRVVERLIQMGCSVRIGSRSAEIPFDWNNQGTWLPVLNGMDAIYITFQPDLAVPGAVNAIRTLSKLAVESNVKHLVLLSGRGEEEAQACEKIIMDAGINWTILRASWFSQNFSESYLLDGILAGHMALPVGNIPEPFIDVDDIADVAVEVLTNDSHYGELYELTGPRLLTFQNAVNEIAAASGRAIQYEQISMDDYKAMLTKYKVPQDIIWLISYLFTEVLDGRNASLADGVQRALDRKPTDFSEYIKKTIATNVWNNETA
ncbi:NAD(P)H-binding protein [Mucilaginibacter sabulilitoris]|uniref:NAD(P)H-binding protein n=1 Tax=Mucilaginibacter sabulilitoris TaxID=1173583 RepID=A0ABZ0TNV4_9SPHI|nr:NAD(P)H-binding protein [Mucilaginibacter sabulilitoris]WPU94486.1 NAD(P)H-binding protein [Mucilaginibacter sabulilitoris]